MKNKEITKKIFFLTIFLLIINFLVFLFDRILGFVIFSYGVIFYFPVLIVLALIDRFYFKNKNSYFLAIIVFVCISIPVLYFLSLNYFNSVFSLM